MAEELFGGRSLDLIKSSTPRCRIDLYSLSGAQYRIEQTISPDAPLVDSALVSLHTQKHRDSPLGVFQINLLDRPIVPGKWNNLPIRQRGANQARRWRDALGKNDIAIIQIQRPPGPWEVVMAGPLTQRPSWRMIAMPSGVERGVTIIGQDFGALLANTKIWYADEIPAAAPEVFILRGLTIFSTPFTMPVGTRATRIAHIFNEAFLRFARMKVPGYGAGGTAKDFIGYALGSTELIPYEASHLTSDGPIWNLMKKMTDEPFQELFVDMIPTDTIDHYFVGNKAELKVRPEEKGEGIKAGTYLVMRNTPWDQDKWSTIPVYKFGLDVIKALELGGSPELFTFFYAQPLESSLEPASRDLINPVFAWNHAATDVHGLNLKIVPFSARRNFGKIDPASIGPFTAEMLKAIREEEAEKLDKMSSNELVGTLSRRLQNWYSKSHEYYSGSVTIQGNPAPRICSRARFTDDDARQWEFYIDGVSHDFTPLGTYDTSLMLSRGVEIVGGEAKVADKTSAQVTAGGASVNTA